MNGEIAAANPRLASPASRNNSALQGATIAFSNSQASSTRAAVASTLTQHAGRRLEMESENTPEVGSVKDKIGLFAGNSTLPPPRAVSRGRTPPPSVGQIAARLAVERSPARVQQATAAVAAAKISAARSASSMQSQAPPEERRELRSPTPIRPRDTAKDNPVNSMLQDDLALSEPESEPELYKKPPSLPPRAASVRVPATSPHPSVSSRMATISLDDRKPNLPPRNPPSRMSTRNPVLTSTPLLRPSTPSMASVSGLSYHSSSSATETGMDEEALSDAIVASSLASARASSATKLAPPPPPRRRARSRSILQFAHSPKNDLSRTPSPPKGMPMTLRGMPKAEEAEAHRRHKVHLLHKHPHKHHEGDRKRWRREVTEKERKRYEGVWASNKGLLIPPNRSKTGRGPNGTEKGPPASEMVLNLVAREIWSRSRLPPAILAQVWDLVDSQQIGLLTKEEFVVGMWLIDQQLKGHKLPVKVPETVWNSVRYVTGIKLTSVGPKG
ncbi:Increased rDNA silencing protein 4 [Penicillium rolfsii]|nr:Increased rDNA silencing protein 4 [Penicillium rolfsii]